MGWTNFAIPKRDKDVPKDKRQNYMCLSYLNKIGMNLSHKQNKDGTNSLKQNNDGLIGTKTKQGWT